MGVPRFIKCGGNIYSVTPSLLKVCITIANKLKNTPKYDGLVYWWCYLTALSKQTGQVMLND